MARHTRRNPQGPLLGKDELAKVEHARRNAKADKRWKEAMKQAHVTKITVDNLERIERIVKELKTGERHFTGGRRTRKHRSTRRH